MKPSPSVSLSAISLTLTHTPGLWALLSHFLSVLWGSTPHWAPLGALDLDYAWCSKGLSNGGHKALEVCSSEEAGVASSKCPGFFESHLQVTFDLP